MNLLRRPTLRRPRREARAFRVRMESLETRTVLSAAIVPTIAAHLETLTSSTDSTDIGPSVSNPSPSSAATSPSELISAYGFSASATAGLGTTIAIVGAYNNPTIQADLAAFSTFYGLAAASLSVVNQYGQTTNLPATDAGWSLETAMDVEWAHAVAPAARIILVEATSSSASDLMTAVQTAARLANVVSMSWGGGEWSGQTAYDTASYFANSNVTFVAASGDDGGASGVSWPASSPYVLSVGGTALYSNGAETAWSASGSYWSGYSGSTGGVSRYESLPSYQATALGTRAASGRVVPDVASVADPSTGLAVYSTASGLGKTGWFTIGGTSAGAPVWAGLVADADQARIAAGKSALSTSQTLSLLYGLYGTSATRSSSYASAFHDVTSGGNFAGLATTGYDVVTGLGSPNASAIISAATSYSAAATTATTTSPTRVVRVRPRAQVHRHDVGLDEAVTGSADAATASEVTVVDTTTTTTTTTTAIPTAPATTTQAVAQATITAATATIALTTSTPAAPPNQPIATAVIWTATTPEAEEPPIAPAIPVEEAPRAEVDADAEAPAPGPTEADPVAPAPDREPEEAAPAAPPVDEEMDVWDAALAQVRIARPAPADGPRTSDEEADDASRMALALGIAAFTWRGARRRPRGRRFVVPVPSRN